MICVLREKNDTIVGLTKSALAYDQAVRAWRNGRQDDELSANVEKPAFVLLAGSAGEQMRSLHEVGQRRVRRVIERLVLARQDGALMMCLGCGAAVQLSAQHLEACGGAPVTAEISECHWAATGPASLPGPAGGGHPPCGHPDLTCSWPSRIWALRCVPGTVPLDGSPWLGARIKFVDKKIFIVLCLTH